ncbi:phosphopantetheine-binding protein [Rhodococcus sp. IEGM 1408]|uniref:phosphopantetheine-binding protein n=1 Tax=Rhodococcus sp. IEGM 1408 TaxID=3082220 RepID=UPI00295402BE|nr:phosphopantetheine-binding protein [Rhodococcus sp. IEGM 1408]MDV8000352.1 phosphopantetheine-binding protein [Rhodococcus sp. IEGM 1408]
MQEIEKRVRDTVSAILGGTVDVDAMKPTDDLFGAGMTSHQTVQVMLGIEYEFDIEFTDGDLIESTFATIASMVRAVSART